MPSIKIDTPELHEVLRLTPPEQNLMLVGRHGIGKSQIITSYFEERGQRVVPFFLGQMSDPGDLIGLPYKDEATGRSEFLPPFWWPVDGQPIVLFLDELNRARPEILQSVMDLTLNRTLAGKALPEGSRVIAAVNEGDQYQLTDLDPALVSRFNLYEFAPSVEDWVDWALSQKLDARVVDFIQRHGEFLDGDPRAPELDTGDGGDMEKSPDRRAWERVARMVAPLRKFEELHVKLVAGIIGTSAAVHLGRAMKSAGAIGAEDVLMRFDGSLDRLATLATPEFAALNQQLLFWIQQNSIKPGARSAKARKVMGNFTSYLELLRDRREAEALAHLASLLEGPRFEVAAQVVLAHPPVLAILMEYIEGITLEQP